MERGAFDTWPARCGIAMLQQLCVASNRIALRPISNHAHVGDARRIVIGAHVLPATRVACERAEDVEVRWRIWTN